jgi:hypothetical protein
MRHYATWAFASTLVLNRKYSVRAASRSQARRAQHRQARALTLPKLRRPPSVSLVPHSETTKVGFSLSAAPQKGKAPLGRPAFPSADTPSPLSPMAVMVVAKEATTTPAPELLLSLSAWGGRVRAEADKKRSVQ